MVLELKPQRPVATFKWSTFCWLYIMPDVLWAVFFCFSKLWNAVESMAL